MLQALIAAATVVLINDKTVLECWEDLKSFLLLDDTIEDYIMKEVEDNNGTLVSLEYLYITTIKCYTYSA